MANKIIITNDKMNDKDEFIKMWESITATVTGVGVLIILTIFPLFYQDYYFDILKAKYRFYYITIIAMAVVLLVVAIIFLCVDLSGCGGKHVKGYLKRINTKTLTLPDWALIAFLLTATISTLLSDYKYESFWGNEGRYTGLFLLLLYGTSFFIISKFLKFKQWYLDAFLASAMIVCGLGIANYFKLDPLGFKNNMNPKQIDSFTSTLGNINTYTAYVALVIGSSTALFAIEKNVIRQIWYFIVTCVSIFALITGISDNAYLALAALVGLLPLFLFSSVRKMKKYFAILAVIFTEFQLIDIIIQKYPDNVTSINGVFNIITQYDKLQYIVITCWGLCGIFYLADYIFFRKKEKKLGPWLQIIWGVLITSCLAGIGYLLYDVNVQGNVEKYGALKTYLVINDNWGTHRWYIWRIGMENYLKFPMKHKIFGFGPDTFGIITVKNNFDEMTNLYGEVFDSAHNEYLQYLFTIGITGLISYLAFLLFSCFRMARNAIKSPAIVGTLFAVVCYGAQAFVNINLPIATPVMWTLLMLGLAGCNNRSMSRDT